MNDGQHSDSVQQFIFFLRRYSMEQTINTVVPEYLRAEYIEGALHRLAERVQSVQFMWFIDQQGNWILRESTNGMLWSVVVEEKPCPWEEADKQANNCRFGLLPGWRLPSKAEILRFSKNGYNPIKKGANDRLFDIDMWHCDKGSIDLDSGVSSEPNKNRHGYILLCNSSYVCKTQELIHWALKNGWSLPETQPTITSHRESNIGEALRPVFRKFGFINVVGHSFPVNATPLEDFAIGPNASNQAGVDLLKQLRHPDMKSLFKDIDYVTCRQPKLEEAQFNDPNKGMWEAWGLTEEDQARLGIRSRNPALDVRDGFVAIDFGTSSTVVAWDNNGCAELMRVGVRDFWEKEKASHYENPTVLEFIDFPSMLSAWQSAAYRPGVLWDDVRCSHEALHNWRNNESDPKIVGSILGRLKQWALRQDADLRVRVADQKNGHEHQLSPLTPRHPVKGQPLSVGSDDPFDPVELYAWFLGMNINWRSRGLFLKYFMSFPVDYPQAVKDNILAAFRRGLQRSLPATFVGQDKFNDFSVEERASEPAAYAAIALPALNVSPGSDSSVAYAVFDFGGGTADFDYGYYRQPTPEEEDEDWEEVFERCGAAGDKFLGGENLLENMAYRTFLHNLDICREKKIAFTRPLDAENFAGSEMFLEKTRAAATNTLMLMARLRPLWEVGTLPESGSGVQKVDLLSRDGSRVSCEFAIPQEALLNYLEQRIADGVDKFIVALVDAFGGEMPGHIHILLAGNASRSAIVSKQFGLLTEDSEPSDPPVTQLIKRRLGPLGSKCPEFTAYPPMPVDEADVYCPTGKTGVALGLLRLCPGGVVKVIDHARHNAGNEAPFAHHVGRIRMGKFQPGLPRGSTYGEWHELGVPRERVFNLFYTQSPLALTGDLTEGDTELIKKPLHLAGDTPGQKVFARAIKPNQIEICTAGSRESVQQQQFDNFHTIDLI